AREAFEEALRYSKSHGKPSARAYYNLGTVYVKLGNKELASNLFKEALDINPRLKEAKAALDGLRSSAEGVTDWWRWWFGDPLSAKSLVGIAAISMLFLLIASTVVPPGMQLFPNKEFTNETTINGTGIKAGLEGAKPGEGPYIKIKETTRETKGLNPEWRLLFAVLLIFILIHPQVRSFSAKEGKIEMEPIVSSKGAAPSREAAK
ncbi:MAG: tetratricopeptide repeat protein, partial [Methanothrix sp.]|nr:tetratricopeptide repeat protein [Methanothrix sp.]